MRFRNMRLFMRLLMSLTAGYGLAYAGVVFIQWLSTLSPESQISVTVLALGGSLFSAITYAALGLEEVVYIVYDKDKNVKGVFTKPVVALSYKEEGGSVVEVVLDKEIEDKEG
jgi:hypothetical protein